jgi:hypothetical protein
LAALIDPLIVVPTDFVRGLSRKRSRPLPSGSGINPNRSK